MSQRIDRARPYPAYLAVVLVGLAAPAVAGESTLLSDLTPEVRRVLAGSGDVPYDDPAALLDRILLASRPYRFREGPLTAITDRRWYATLPPSVQGAPLMVLRRWPGDTVLAAYALEGAAAAEHAEAPEPPLAGAEATGSRTVQGGRRWELRLETPLGERFAEWHERAVPESAWRLGLLLVPGDAGLGPRSAADRLHELRAVAARLELDTARAAGVRPWPPGVRLAPPMLGAPPGVPDEGRDPWQVARGLDFTLGLPPGLRVKAVQGVTPPVELPGQALWIRGRFIDRDGIEVIVGDGERAGYVAEVDGPPETWREGRTPARAPGKLSPVSGDRFEVAEEGTGCATVRAERWKETGFEGEWLVFRLACRTRGLEIGLPVVAGRQSLALFWIPVTWRDAGRPPAPPPIDAAQRFGIRFEKLYGKDRRDHPMTEGYLVAPGFRMQIAKGWWPVANLRSADGFPIRLLDATGSPAGLLWRIDPVKPQPASDGWVEEKRPRPYGAERVLHRRDGSWLYESRHGFAFRLEPETLDDRSRKTWEQMARTVQLSRPRR